MFDRLLEDKFLGVRFAVNVFIATIVVWITLGFFTQASPIWAIASSEPVVKQASRCSGA
jgi:low affinity Fe/Cu permease